MYGKTRWGNKEGKKEAPTAGRRAEEAAGESRCGPNVGLTEEEEIAVARILRTEIKGKEQFGYITRIPTEAEIQEAKKGVEAADAQRQFERFGGYYQADAIHTQPHFAEEQA